MSREGMMYDIPIAGYYKYLKNVEHEAIIRS